LQAFLDPEPPSAGSVRPPSSIPADPVDTSADFDASTTMHSPPLRAVTTRAQSDAGRCGASSNGAAGLATAPRPRGRLADRHLQQAFSACCEIFGDEDVLTAAMIDLLVHHAEILALKGDSHRGRDLARATSAD
jgi:hypothetical protein